MGNSFNSIEEQYINTELLIGLKENEKLKEMNAILQCLFHVTPLVDYFKYKFDNIEDIESYKLYHKKKICLTDSLKDLIDKVWPKDVKGKRDGNLQKITRIWDYSVYSTRTRKKPWTKVLKRQSKVFFQN